MQTLFSLREAARLFGLKESRLRYWAQTGFVNPSAKRQGRRLYTFSDLVEIRAARDLLAAGIPLQRVRKGLHALRRALPGREQLLGRLHVRGDGEILILADPNEPVSSLSGQMLLDFPIDEIERQVAEVLELARGTGAPPLVGGDDKAVVPAGGESRTSGATAVPSEPGGGPDAAACDSSAADSESKDAYGWYLRGCRLDADPELTDTAMAAYRRAVALDPTLAAAHTNLGNLHYQRGERQEALNCYQMACTLDPEQPEARYNLANLYDDESDTELAIAEYRRVLRLSPDFADAHFNLALALERLGSRVQAVSHFRAFIDLASGEGGASAWVGLAQQHLAALEARNNAP